MRALRDLVEQREEVIGINRRNVELVYAHNPRSNYRFADDKLLCKELLRDAGVPVPDTIAVCDGLHAIPAALEAVATRSDFVLKPASAGGGRGILVVGEQQSDGAWRSSSGAEVSREDLRQQLANIVYGAFSNDIGDRAYIEERIVGHAVLHELWSQGLSDIRVIALQGEPLMAMLRVPTRESDGRANLHQGALGLALSLDRGVSFRAWHRGEIIRSHPDTGRSLSGLRIPGWSAVLDVARRSARGIPLGYLGIDMVLDAHGTPLVLEVNARPGLEIQNVNGCGLGRALTVHARQVPP
jgi:alpha-L-glutamate ligase-like protein